jgi:hypothetical protein
MFRVLIFSSSLFTLPLLSHRCRWWFEQIGFWGAPGTAPPDEAAPIGIHAINVPAEPSPVAYQEKYPDGFTAPYSTAVAGTQEIPSSVGLSSLLLAVVIFLLGIGIGGGLTMLMVKNRGVYSQLN